MSRKTRWVRVRKDLPCPVCKHTDWCMVAHDGSAALCGRIEQGAAARTKGGWVHRLTAGVNGPGHERLKRINSVSQPHNSTRNWAAEADRLRAAMNADHLTALVESTGVPAAAWAHLSPGWATTDDLHTMRTGGAGWRDALPEGAFVFEEHAGDGRVVGLSLRAIDRRKGAPAGAKRGLIVPSNLHVLPDPVLVVEGASDVAACSALGLAAVGRPSNRAGAADVAVLLEGRAVLVVGEQDSKPGGAWPGRDGAKAVAQEIAGRWGEPVSWTLPPAETKDVREWFRSRLADGLRADDTEAMRKAGAELLSVLTAAAKTIKPPRRAQADVLVDLARERYHVGLSNDGDAFGVAIDGPAIALTLRGGSAALRAALAKSYRAATGKTARASALTDALITLEGMAHDTVPVPVALRLADLNSSIVLDLGDPTGRVAVVTTDGWTIESASPVLMRRTALTGAMPEPQQAVPADLGLLRTLLNVDDDTWPLVVGWLVAALMPSFPHPLLMLGGEQGTGKSTAARLLTMLIDPSPAPLRSEPRDPEQWAIATAGSWCVCLDNVSHISGWLSDAICKAITGDGWVRRRLYSDSEPVVLTFRRAIMLTSIDPGAMRGDLGDRLLLVDLARIDDGQRRTESELHAAYEAMRPRLLGALLSALSRTLVTLPHVHLQAMPRMADFARVLAALDRACHELTGGRALELFLGQRSRIADEVVDGDSVAVAVVRLMENHERWSGTAGELLAAITPTPVPKDWPANARALSGRLRRLRPALLVSGIRHDAPSSKDKTRTHRMERTAIVPPIPPECPYPVVEQRLADSGRTDGSAEPSDDRQPDGPHGNGGTAGVASTSGGSGGSPRSLSTHRIGIPDAPYASQANESGDVTIFDSTGEE